MTNATNVEPYVERRGEIRIESDDVIRWKRPGRFEDRKAWTLDKSQSGIGFLTLSENAPIVGDMLHIRRRDGKHWAPLNGEIRVARAAPTSGDGLVMIGCQLVHEHVNTQ